MDCFKLLTSKEGNKLTINDNLERKKRFRIQNRFGVNNVMIQHFGGQVKPDLWDARQVASHCVLAQNFLFHSARC